jgi:hypothetical protein
MDRSTVRQTATIVCIIAVIAAILVGPVMGVAIKPGAKQVCQDNLRAIWKAINAYQADNSGILPPVDDGGMPLRSWCDFILPYGVTKSILICPSQDLAKEKIWRTIPQWGYTTPYAYGYTINSSISLYNGPLNNSLAGVPLNYDRVLLVGDGYWSWFAYDDSWDPYGKSVTSPQWWSNKVAWRHPGPPDLASTKAATNFITVSGQVVNLKRPVNQSQYIIDLTKKGTGATP